MVGYSSDQTSAMNPFARTFEPDVSAAALNPFAMDFQPQVLRAEEKTTMNPFAMDFAPQRRSAEDKKQRKAAAFSAALRRKFAEDEAAKTAKPELPLNPCAMSFEPAAGQKELETTVSSPVSAPVVLVPPMMVWSPSPPVIPGPTLPSWLPQAPMFEGRKRSMSGSASPVSTRLDDDGCGSSSSDSDNEYFVENESVFYNEKMVTRSNDPGVQKGQQILSLLKDFGFGGAGERMPQQSRRGRVNSDPELAVGAGTLPRCVPRAETTGTGTSQGAQSRFAWKTLTAKVEKGNEELLSELADFQRRSVNNGTRSYHL